MKMAAGDDSVSLAHKMDCGVHVSPDKASSAPSSLK